MYGLEAKGTRGKCAILGIDGTCNQACATIQAKERTSNLFVFYYYQKLGEGITKWVAGTKRQNLTLGIVKGLQLPLPSLEEQNKIVNILTETDTKLQQEQAHKTQLEQLKKGLMQQLLTGKVRVKT